MINQYVLQGLISKDQIVKDDFPEDFFSLIVMDNFKTSQKEIDYFSKFAKVISIDDGAGKKVLKKIAYTLNIIPSEINPSLINFTNYDFIPVPNTHKEKSVNSISQIKNILIAFGGIDKSLFALKIAQKIESLFLSEKNEDFKITIITSNQFILENQDSSRIVATKSIENLREHFADYDLVFTHYGFTAFEAVSSNCLVFTFAPTKLHKKLSKKMGFVNLSHGISEAKLKSEILKLINDKGSDFIIQLKKNNINNVNSAKNLSDFVQTLAAKEIFSCPICNSSDVLADKVICRDKIKTIRKCKKCNLDYISFENTEKTEYNADYFGIEYKNQYGKTYLEDFNSIKKSCLRRHEIVNSIFRKKICKDNNTKGKILDIGCAYGPYLSAASDLGWLPFGIEPSTDAVDYVKNKLNFNAICSKFPVETLPKDYCNFDAVTMWYVIEHFEKLDEVLKTVNALLKNKGIFAFSTPSNCGISGKYNKTDFYKNSPSDHFSIWNPRVAKKILKNYGFKTVKIVSTGIHPERYPFIKKHGIKETKFLYKLFELHAKLFKLGDTFEIYATKK